MFFKKITQWMTKEKKKDEDEVAEPDTETDEVEFKTFPETFQIISFVMSIGLMYPNPATRWFRLIGTFVTLIAVGPIASFMLIDIYFCWLRKDIFEIIRHSTIVGPFLGGFLKMLFMVWFQDSGFAIIKEMNRDFALYNRLTDEYKNVARTHLRNSIKYSEGWWAVTVVTCVASFPVMAALQTLYEYCFNAEPKKYMVHELNKPWSSDPESRFESPYYELTNLHMVFCAVLYVLNFLGYDGFYGLAINHACLKINLYCKALEDAMKYDVSQVHQRVVWVIEEQNRTFRFMELIEECFNTWLGVIFLATMIQLCNLLYNISEGLAFDLRYTIFITGCIVHIFLPCHYSSKLKVASMNVSSAFYCSGWENVHDERVRKMLAFMIARAQVPQEVTAFGMLIFDMELFVSIMQTSYSMYTLLSS